jgi:hypothetical protein
LTFFFRYQVENGDKFLQNLLLRNGKGKKEMNHNLQMLNEFNKKYELDAMVLACREPYLMKVTYMLVFHPSTRFALIYDEAREDLF